MRSRLDRLRGISDELKDRTESAADRVADTSKKVADSTSSIADSAQGVSRQAASIAGSSVGQVSHLSQRTLKATHSIAAGLAATTRGLLASDLSNDLNDLLQGMTDGNTAIYGKTLDVGSLAASASVAPLSDCSTRGKLSSGQSIPSASHRRTP